MNSHATLLSFALIGLVLGLRHATDADHIVAVTTMVTRERRLGAAIRIGVAWGLGHTATILATGAAILVFRLAIPPSLNTYAEGAVGVMLIALGLWAIASRPVSIRAGGSEVKVHSHAHSHDGGVIHSHPHVHTPDTADSHREHRIAAARTMAPGSDLRAFAVGMVHGLAGSAALALAVLAAIARPLWGVLYLAIFGAGAMLGMAAITVVIAAPGMLAAGKFARANDYLRLGSGAASIALGIAMLAPIAL